MSLALGADQVDAAVSDARRRHVESVARSYGLRPGSAAVLRAGVGKRAGGAPYQPDLEAYRPDPKNDRARELQRQLKSPKWQVTASLSVLAADGRREHLDLGEADARAYFEAPLTERLGIQRRKIAERRFPVALAAARRLAEHKGIAFEGLLSVDDELCLREYGGLEDRRTRVLEDDGSARYRELPRLVDGWLGAAKRIATNASDAPEPGRFREAFYGRRQQIGAGAPRDRDVDEVDWLSRGPTSYQVNISDVWDEQAKARYAYRTDPFAKQGIKIRTDFCLGRGVTVEASDERVQAVLDEFNGRHKMRRKLKEWTTSLGIYGNLFVRLMRLGNGRIKAVKTPAPTIWEIWTEDEDINAPIAYVQRFSTRPQMFRPNSVHYVSREIPAVDMLHLRVNAEDDEIFGRGDGYANLGWHRRFRNYFDAEIAKARAQAAYQWTATLEGDKKDVDAFISESIPDGEPEPGSWMVVNDKVKIEAVPSGTTGNTSGSGSIYEGLLNVLSAGYGFAKEYFGVSGNRTRGGALVASEPSAKAFEERQDDIGLFLDDLYRAVLAEAQRYGLLDGVTDFTFKVQFPAIIKSDAIVRTELLQIGRTNGYISATTAGPVWASEAEIEDYDFEQEQLRIAEERAKYGIEAPSIAQLPQGFDTVDPKATTPNAASLGTTGQTPGVRMLVAPKRPNLSVVPGGKSGAAGEHPMAGVGSGAIRRADAHAEALKILQQHADVLREAGAVVIFE